ncbi:MAG: hypothetical protein WBC85_01950 [Planktotalea sp.]|uniref:hypothetical protein n=1 Tax=Planktotalea sp. TaxID=2029877 RepID=UPI003C7792A4
MGYSHLQQKSGFVILSERDRRANANYVTIVDKNGLIQVVPRRKSRSQISAPFKLLALFAVLLIVFKALALVNVGIVDYDAELAVLQAGNMFEKAGAFVLKIDPVTQAIYQQVGPLLK